MVKSVEKNEKKIRLTIDFYKLIVNGF